MTQLSRATSVETLKAKFAMLDGAEDSNYSLAVKLRPTDLVITPYGKSGTTWTQQIVHCMSMEVISQRSWISAVYGQAIRTKSCRSISWTAG